VDAFPKETFSGVVSQIRMNPTTVQNVVTYNAIIDFANPELKLFPGMTAYVTIPVATVENAVKLPNAALRFKPPLSGDAIRALVAKYRLDERLSPRGDAPSAPAGTAVAPGTRVAARGGALGDPEGGEPVVVWKLVGERALVPVKVTLGITDHAYTEVTAVIAGTLQPGDDLVTTSLTAKSGAAGMPGVRR
jgi:HlyD family secretion protein